jgi:hypothetical protein
MTTTQPRPRDLLQGMGHVREPERDDWWRSWLVRTTALLLGTLALGVAFVWAYAGVLHDPTPRDVPVGVVRGDAPAQALLATVRAQSDAIEPIEYADVAAAADALERRSIYAIVGGADVGGAGLTLTTASASGPAATDLVVQTLTGVADAAQVSTTVVDAVPASAGDGRGLVPFYLVVGLVLAGYLASTALGLNLGTVPRDLDRAAMRIAALAVFSALAGIAAALVTGPILGIFTEHRPGLAIAGALITFAAAMIAAAVQGWLGLLGTGLVILLLVVLGNPGSGGIYPPEFLPPFFRSMHTWNVPGLGVDLVRSVVYFERRAAAWPITALALWSLLGVGGLLGATAVLGKRAHRPVTPLAAGDPTADDPAPIGEAGGPTVERA